MIIKELTLLTDDLIETERFYTEVLGLTMVDKTESGVSFSAGATLLRFEKSTGQKPRYHFAFNIPTNTVDDAFRQMSAKLELLPISDISKIADFVNWNAKSFYFYDNNSNILEFIGRFDLGKQETSSFTAASVLCVSEIGLPVKNVKKECEALISRYGFAYFAKQPPSDTFSVIGEDTGLLIVVPIGRNWYPTNDMASEAHYVRLIIMHSGKEMTLSYHESTIPKTTEKQPK
ncbi:VOC family protein [Runella sp.]|uniref:VOC family protein n=1 Tax=Runella sp. TaxID=1960881 RepID=UPI003D1303FA